MPWPRLPPLASSAGAIFQITKYGPISTPYCEEEQIARVAQSYGIRVTGAEVRSNALKKVYLCQTIGNDSRLKGSCASYAPELRGRSRTIRTQA